MSDLRLWALAGYAAAIISLWLADRSISINSPYIGLFFGMVAGAFVARASEIWIAANRLLRARQERP